MPSTNFQGVGRCDACGWDRGPVVKVGSCQWCALCVLDAAEMLALRMKSRSHAAILVNSSFMLRGGISLEGALRELKAML